MARNKKKARPEPDAKPAVRADAVATDDFGLRLEAAWRLATDAPEAPAPTDVEVLADGDPVGALEAMHAIEPGAEPNLDGPDVEAEEGPAGIAEPHAAIRVEATAAIDDPATEIDEPAIEIDESHAEIVKPRVEIVEMTAEIVEVDMEIEVDAPSEPIVDEADVEPTRPQVASIEAQLLLDLAPQPVEGTVDWADVGTPVDTHDMVDPLSEDGWWETLRASPPILGYDGDERSSLDVQRDFSAEWDAKVAAEEALEAADDMAPLDDPVAEMPADLQPGDSEVEDAVVAGDAIGDDAVEPILEDNWHDWSATDAEIHATLTPDEPVTVDESETIDESTSVEDSVPVENSVPAEKEPAHDPADVDGPIVAWTDVMLLAHDLRGRVDELETEQRRFLDGLDQWRLEISLDVARIRDAVTSMAQDPTDGPTGS